MFYIISVGLFFFFVAALALIPSTAKLFVTLENILSESFLSVIVVICVSLAKAVFRDGLRDKHAETSTQAAE